MNRLQNNLSLYLLLVLVLGIDIGISIMVILNSDQGMPTLLPILGIGIAILITYLMAKHLTKAIMEVCKKAADQEVTDQEHKHEKE